MAICAVPLKAWEDVSLPFKDKFKAGSYWDHQGSRCTTKDPGEGLCGAGIKWQDEIIETIEAVECLGMTDLSDDDITNGRKSAPPSIEVPFFLYAYLQ